MSKHRCGRAAGVIISMASLCTSSASMADDRFASAYKDLVDNVGNITLPADFRAEWTFLGTWSVAEKTVGSADAGKRGAAGLHNVYTQPGVAQFYQKNGAFPDGAIVIKELLKGKTAPMTTGTVSHGTEVEGWFVMVKDTQQRFRENPLWGDGWGWVLFGPDRVAQTTSYKTECLTCHVPAKDTDWIYIDGYPMLHPLDK
ncbi:MAG: cytochrome P460 family protein [Pseudomonadales bacterium]